MYGSLTRANHADDLSAREVCERRLGEYRFRSMAGINICVCAGCVYLPVQFRVFYFEFDSTRR